MNTLTRLTTLILSAALLITLSACDDDSNPAGPEEPVELEVQTVEDVPADPTVTIGDNGRPQGLNQHTFFSLRDGEIVVESGAEVRADSNSTAWDIALQSTTIRVNGGTSGPGNGAAYVAEAAFEDVTEVNTDQLESDTEEALAIPTGSGNGWYNYNSNGQNYIRPIPGRTIVVRTADGEGYAKIRVQSYYEGAPDLPIDNREEHPSRYYTFDYVVQTNGSTAFE